ncbi:AraC family transcriptional regulator [Nostoc sp. UHCC 0926]|uniref:AraC family transcriptional regulator n=1 Tax=unclassified Nostoc TaxID=2593658 RepID=UPI0023628754|nr:AraC family transcriptional regulator [Nostoc sp. UHCC 0926]WDD30755.1 AraC family transcriptional regulator [Nostoc sp. UHCC 0926]
MNNLQNPEPNEFIYQISSWEGKGYERAIEVHPNLWLSISDIEQHHDYFGKITEYDHPVQFQVLLAGKNLDEYGGQVGEGYTLISGSGVQRAMFLRSPKGRVMDVNIEMPTDLLRTFFPDEDGQILPQLKFLTKGNDWQTLLYPQTTTAIQGVAQQIVNCPYKGITKRMYLQGKIQELMALQLAPILAEQDGLQPFPRLKAQTIVCIHHAKEILLSRLDNPPSLMELAQMVGVSSRTLRYGFKEVFGTTVFGYLTEQRMEQAEQLLRSGKLSIAEVANLIGYSQPGNFAAVFKRKFGITPSECLSGKKNIFGDV